MWRGFYSELTKISERKLAESLVREHFSKMAARLDDDLHRAVTTFHKVRDSMAKGVINKGPSKGLVRMPGYHHNRMELHSPGAAKEVGEYWRGRGRAAVNRMIGSVREKTKISKKLTYKARENLSGGAFVFPGERRYPIHDESHARNALARASGKSEEGKVRAAVHARYPNIGKEKSSGVIAETIGGIGGAVGVEHLISKTHPEMTHGPRLALLTAGAMLGAHLADRAVNRREGTPGTQSYTDGNEDATGMGLVASSWYLQRAQSGVKTAGIRSWAKSHIDRLTTHATDTAFDRIRERSKHYLPHAVAAAATIPVASGVASYYGAKRGTKSALKESEKPKAMEKTSKVKKEKDDPYSRASDSAWSKHKKKIVSGLAIATAVGVGAKLLHNRHKYGPTHAAPVPKGAPPPPPAHGAPKPKPTPKPPAPPDQRVKPPVVVGKPKKKLSPADIQANLDARKQHRQKKFERKKAYHDYDDDELMEYTQDQLDKMTGG